MERALVVALIMVGCATSYESAVSNQTLGGGGYLITADGNGWTKPSTIEQYKYRRAAELCPDGFDVLDANQSMRTSIGTADGGKTYGTINKPSGSLVIRCKPQEARTPDVAAAPAPIPTRGWWCTTITSGSDASVSCERAIEQCKETRAFFKTKGITSTDCAARHEAACFSAYNGQSKRSSLTCRGDLTECAAARSYLDADPNWTLEGDCRFVE